MNYLVSAVYFDWAKGKVGVHQLSVLEQILKSDNEFLKGICIFEFDGPVNDSSGKLMGMCVNYGMGFFCGSIGRLGGGEGFACLLLLFVRQRTARLEVLTALRLIFNALHHLG
jgi:hypothetical protein